jgi:hypothetical protein
MRFPSGVTDQYIYFVAVDSSDLITRETGLSSFTVYRIRNAASTPTAYTTPTITEVSSANMPGVYSLLLDEDMTITSGDHSNEVCLHITQASMAPVTLKYELYRTDVTQGETITVASGIPVANVTQFNGSNATSASGRPEVNTSHIAGSAVSTSSAQIGVNVVNAAGTAWNSGAIGANTLASDTITAAKIAPDAIGASELAADAATEIGTAVWATTTRQLTALDEDVTTLDLDATIRAATGQASANFDTAIAGINTNIDANEAKIDIVDTVLDALVADIGANGSGLTAVPWNSSWDAEVESEVDDALVAYSAAKDTDIPTVAQVADAVWDEILSGHAIPGSTGEALDSAGGGSTPPTVEEIADELETRILDVNIVQVNEIPVDGSGTEEDPWGP